jgi:nucleotide-binding universal stress UspA family protein
MIPPRTILAATDFSEASQAALGFAARLARHCRAALHIVHAEDPLLAAAARQSGFDLATQTREELQQLVASARPAAECAPTLHAPTGSAVETILGVAHAEHADLVIAGSHGMSGAARLVFGSTTEGLLRRSVLPVLVVPPGWTAPRAQAADLAGMGPLIAGIDMTEESLEAARAACRLASTLGTTVEAVHVVPQLAVPARWQPHATRALEDRVSAARGELEGMVRDLACGAPIEWRVDTGAVADRLASIAAPAERGVPLLVLGKKAPHSRGGAPGTIAYRVLSLAQVPVLTYVAPSA